MAERLYAVDKERIVVIDEKDYVKVEDKNRLVDTSREFKPVYFVGEFFYKWFPDDPVPGGERTAFRESSLTGPFYSEPLIKDEERDDEGNLHETSIFSEVIPANTDPVITRYWRNSLRLTINEMEHQFYRERLPKKQRELRELHEQVTSQVKERAKWKLNPNGDMIGMADSTFFYVGALPVHKHYQPERIKIDVFGPVNKSVAELFSIPISDFQAKTFQFEYDMHISSEEFVSLSSSGINLQHNSLEDIVSNNPQLIPNTLEVLGKH